MLRDETSDPLSGFRTHRERRQLRPVRQVVRDRIAPELALFAPIARKEPYIQLRIGQEHLRTESSGARAIEARRSQSVARGSAGWRSWRRLKDEVVRRGRGRGRGRGLDTQQRRGGWGGTEPRLVLSEG
jgi:hypothetical protein